MRRLWRALVVMALVGCNSPTLPLPPPAVPSVERESNGTYKLHSDHGAEPNAIVVVYNHNPALSLEDRVEGAQADGTGTWDSTIVASPGDVIDVTQEFGSVRSASTTFQIPR